jgi:hypothetical protein
VVAFHASDEFLKTSHKLKTNFCMGINLKKLCAFLECINLQPLEHIFTFKHIFLNTTIEFCSSMVTRNSFIL